MSWTSLEQLDACGRGYEKTSVDGEKDEVQTMRDDNMRSNVQMKIITVEDSSDSDDEDVLSRTILSTALATTVEIPKFCREDIFYGPPLPVDRQAVLH